MEQELSIVFSGEAGQGLKTVESLLAGILKAAGFNVFATKEYMSRVRGGVNTTSLRVSAVPVSAYVERIDILIPFSPGRTDHLQARINDQTIIIEEGINDNPLANITAVGIICGALKISQQLAEASVKKQFMAKGETVVKNNLDAAAKGYGIGQKLLSSGRLKIELKKDAAVKNHLLLNGEEAVALGAMAGGCNFIAAYPMTPATGILTFLAKQAKDFGLVVEQAEDEIAAMNMALGAWYAGARALVSTAGGGFALMVEGLSLAGMLEMPVVINLGQRPAPATGLPTRTEQGDLNFALHAGHGEFARVILAPGDLAEAFYLTQYAFNLADQCQLPVFIMTDQYLMDSYYNLPELKLGGLTVEKQIVKTAADYKRYQLTDSGISPRGVPGFGDGLVIVDSDEHDEEGHITEDLGLRDKMVQKRLKKLELAAAAALAPKFLGSEDYEILVIGWGSTYPIIKEAVEKLGREDLAYLHFNQVYPLHQGTLTLLKQAKKVVVIEHNATGQFADLFKLKLGFEVSDQINKFNGLPFSVEEITQALNEVING